MRADELIESGQMIMAERLRAGRDTYVMEGEKAAEAHGISGMERTFVLYHGL